jgi:hypothetical protein
MEKETLKVESNSVMSVVLSPAENIDIKNLSDHLGISLSHLGRALIRLGLQTIEGVHEEAKDEVLLRLIKLGK